MVPVVELPNMLVSEPEYYAGGYPEIIPGVAVFPQWKVVDLRCADAHASLAPVNPAAECHRKIVYGIKTVNAYTLSSEQRVSEYRGNSWKQFK